MHHALSAIGRFISEDHGQDLVEYGLLAGLVAVVAIAGIGVLGQTIFTVFWEVIARAF